MPTVSDYTAILPVLVQQRWNNFQGAAKPAFISYSFETSAPDVLNETALAGFRSFDEVEKSYARAAFEKWDMASGLTFFEVPAGQGDIRMAITSTLLNSGEAYFTTMENGPAGRGLSRAPAPIVIDADIESFGADYVAYVYAHEIGHALGFKHPFEGPTVLDPSLTTLENTVMAYPDFSDLTTIRPQSPLGSLDLEAARWLYGDSEMDGDQAASYSWNPATHELFQVGNANDNVLLGIGGRDVIDSNEGDDVLAGFGGDDLLRGGTGDDVLFGAQGSDTLKGGNGADELYGGEGTDNLFGGLGNDTYHVTNSGDVITEVIAGGTADRFIVYGLTSFTLADNVEIIEVVSAATLRVKCNANANIVYGGAGVDTIFGMDGNDILRGGSGSDIISGGLGRDVLVGGLGSDTFDFNAVMQSLAKPGRRDIITDFVAKSDDIDLSTIDASTRWPGNQSFKFIGSKEFSGRAGELRVQLFNAEGVAQDKTLIEGDVTGDGKADFQIELKGLNHLTALDFVL